MKITRTSDHIREFENGDIVIKYDELAIKQAEHDSMLVLSEVLSHMDCTIVGLPYCLNNYDMGFTVYNWHSDYCYVLPCSEIPELKAGNSVRLYAHKPDDDEMEMIQEF